MRNIWVISDTHFNHSNVLTFKDNNEESFIRPQFKNVGEMNECMSDNWNSVVNVGDIVYHLGDVYFGNKDEAVKIIKKLNGRKRLIVGNHDNIKDVVKLGMFQKVNMWRMFPEFGLLLTHVPVHESSLHPQRENMLINLHGHIHERKSPTDKHINMCVEVNNYTPVNMEELRQI